MLELGFRQRLELLSREELLSIIREQNPNIIKDIRRIEWVFENKLRHLTWPDGNPILGRPLTQEELALLIDEPFSPDHELTQLGISLVDQRRLHIAKDPILWARNFLEVEPRAYQILILRHPSLRKVLRAGRRLGKRLDINTPMWTTTGWSTMGKLQIGDQVFDEKGQFCNITYVSPIEVAPKSYKVVFSDGSHLLADAEHQWIVDTKLSRKALGRSNNPVAKPILVTTQEMIDAGIKTKVYTNKAGIDKYETNFSIRLAEPVEQPEKVLPIDPYILGLYLGDGTSSWCQMTTADKEIVVAFDEAGYTLVPKEHYNYRVTGDFWQKYKELGLRCNKHIPDIYMMGSIEQREELLKGLMDSDGCCDAKTKCCEFTPKNERLAHQVKSLIESLGYRAQIRKDPARLYGKDCGFRNRISFTPWRSVFKLYRKLDTQAIKAKPSGWQLHRYIIDIVPIAPIEMRCISVDSPSSLYLAGDNFIPTHNSWTMAVVLLHYSYTHNYGRCIVVAPMKSQVEIIYQEILKLASQNGIVSSSITRKVTSPQFTIEFTNGSGIKFFTSGVKCLTPDHDVLTEHGWKSIADVTVGERVISYKEGALILSVVSDTPSYDFDGELVTHSGKQISFRVTPDHKFLAKSTGPNSEFHLVEATELKQYWIPTSGEALPAETKEFSGDELELWGWWISEGSGFIGNCARFAQKKQPGIDRIIELVTNLGLKYKFYQYGNRAAEIRVTGWKPPIYSGTNCFDKFIPRELFNEQHRDRLLQGMLSGDGWIRKKGWEYSSSSFQLVNDVQELAIRMGLRANLREKKIKYVPVGGGVANRHWIVSAYAYPNALINPKLLSREQYIGKVHCLTVPETGIFLTRRDGLIHFTTNSGGKADVVRGQEAHIIVLDELDYMHGDDLESLYAMLQKTAEDQPDKILIGASTPTGARGHFWDFCHSTEFKEFWFPSYTNPFFEKKDEDFFHQQYSEMGYRHEVEADWGEDVQGVYPRRYVDAAVVRPGWEYKADVTSARSFFVFGVDWDKFGAGTSIVVLEVCQDDYEVQEFQGKIRLAFREETPKEEFTLTNAVTRIIELNKIFNPRFIYVDRGFGECVGPDTLITAQDSTKRIADIAIGDSVLTEDGQFHKVTDKIVQTDAKNAYKVKVHKTLPVVVSDTHPFLTMEGEWRNITELKVGDYVALPKLKLKEESTIVDLLDLVPTSDHDDDFIWKSNANRWQTTKIKRHIDLGSKEFLAFAGWYLSEGSVTKRTMEISQTIGNQAYLDEIKTCLKSTFGIEPCVYDKSDNRKETYLDSKRYCINSTVLCSAIDLLLGGGSERKHIPFQLLGHPELALSCVRSLMSGDGHYNHRGTTNISYQLTLTSVTLLDQIRLLLQSQDIPVSFYKVKKAEEHHKDRWRIDILGDSQIRERFSQLTGCDFSNEVRINRRSFKTTDDYIFMPIRKIEFLGEVTGLIDIEVEGVHSFVGNGLVLHNTQVELLLKHGIENPDSQLRKRVVGIQFSETLEMPDPATKQMVKKDIKPFMVDNLRQFLEKGLLFYPELDEELYMQLISYVVARVTPTGRPVFEMNGSNVADHAHDALILACLAITQNYGELMRVRLARKGIAVSSDTFLPMFETDEQDEAIAEAVWGSKTSGPTFAKRAMSVNMGKVASKPFKRKSF